MSCQGEKKAVLPVAAYVHETRGIKYSPIFENRE
jgi:hypothetical protein